MKEDEKFWDFENLPFPFSLKNYKESLELISRLINPNKIMILGLEIGVGWGISANFMLNKFRNMFLTSMDNNNSRPAIKTLYEKYRNRFKFYDRETPLLDEVVFDYVYIDGDHLIDGVKRDIEDFVPKVAPGGVLVFDDYNNKDYNSDVKFTVDKFLDWSLFYPKIEIDNQTGHLVLIRR